MNCVHQSGLRRWGEVLQMRCQAYLQFRPCVWQKKTAVLSHIPLACSAGPKRSPPQSMASMAIRLPLHRFPMSETGPPLSPTWRTLRNHHRCHDYCQTGVIACNAESAASWEPTRRKLTQMLKTCMRELCYPTVSALTEIMNEQ